MTETRIRGAAEPREGASRPFDAIGSIRARLGSKAGAALLRGAGAAFVIQFAGIGLKYVSQVVLARWLGTTEYGVFSYAYAWTQVLAVGAGLGLVTGALRFVPQYRSAEERGPLRGFLRWSRLLVVAAGVAIAAVGSAVLAGLDPPGPAAGALSIALWLVPLVALLNLQASIVRGFRRIARAFAPGALLEPVLTVGVAAGVLHVAGWLDGRLALLALGVSLLVVTSVQGLIVRGLAPREGPVEPRPAEWLRVSIPMLAVSGSLIVLNKTDLLMVGSMVGAEAAGMYAAASRVATLIVFGLGAVNSILAPMVSELHGTGRMEELQRLLRLAAVGILAFSVPAGVVMLVWGEVILGMFGGEFSAAHPLLVVLVAGQLVNALSGSVGVLLNMTGNQDDVARVMIVAGVANVILNACLIPVWGAEGAAVATAVATAGWNIALVVLVRRRLGLRATALGL